MGLLGRMIGSSPHRNTSEHHYFHTNSIGRQDALLFNPTGNLETLMCTIMKRTLRSIRLEDVSGAGVHLLFSHVLPHLTHPEGIVLHIHRDGATAPVRHKGIRLIVLSYIFCCFFLEDH